ncbi:MAG: RbsD/FucU family protein [Oscillospiraceae bacterium]
MLKNIPDIISPELLKILHEMGHGDCLCIGDGNFPAASTAKFGDAEIVRLDGHKVPEILDAILTLFPLDNFITQPVKLMERCDGVNEPCPIWAQYEKIIAKYDERGKSAIQFVERFAYYEEARKCYAVVATGETATFANIILQKGVVIH